jgi:hypothetical protein
MPVEFDILFDRFSQKHELYIVDEDGAYTWQGAYEAYHEAYHEAYTYALSAAVPLQLRGPSLVL